MGGADEDTDDPVTMTRQTLSRGPPVAHNAAPTCIHVRASLRADTRSLCDYRCPWETPGTRKQPGRHAYLLEELHKGVMGISLIIIDKERFEAD